MMKDHAPPSREMSPPSVYSTRDNTQLLDRYQDPMEEISRLTAQVDTLEREKRAAVRAGESTRKFLEQDLEEMQEENGRLRTTLSQVNEELERTKYALSRAEEREKRPPSPVKQPEPSNKEELRRMAAKHAKEVEGLTAQLEGAHSSDRALVSLQKRHTAQLQALKTSLGVLASHARDAQDSPAAAEAPATQAAGSVNLEDLRALQEASRDFAATVAHAQAVMRDAHGQSDISEEELCRALPARSPGSEFSGDRSWSQLRIALPSPGASSREMRSTATASVDGFAGSRHFAASPSTTSLGAGSQHSALYLASPTKPQAPVSTEWNDAGSRRSSVTLTPRDEDQDPPPRVPQGAPPPRAIRSLAVPHFPVRVKEPTRPHARPALAWQGVAAFRGPYRPVQFARP